MKKKFKILIPVVIILIIFLVVLFIVLKDNNKIELKQNEFIYELGENISSDVFVYLKEADTTKNIKKYNISSDDLSIKDNHFIKDESLLVPVGEYSVNISIKDKSQKFTIKVVDTIKPEFINFKELIEIEEGTKNVDLISFFEVKDYSNFKLTISGNYDISKTGEYNLKVIAEDDYHNISKQDFILKVNKKIDNEIKETPSKNINTSNDKNNTLNSNNNDSSNQNEKTVSSNGYKKSVADSYITQINNYRKENGLSELPVTSEAQAEADRRAKELVSNYSHDGAGYGFGEIIGNGGVNSDFITAWKNSPSHNASMLREQNVAMAASVYEYNNHWYAVVSFRMNY